MAFTQVIWLIYPHSRRFEARHLHDDNAARKSYTNRIDLVATTNHSTIPQESAYLITVEPDRLTFENHVVYAIPRTVYGSIFGEHVCLVAWAKGESFCVSRELGTSANFRGYVSPCRAGGRVERSRGYSCLRSKSPSERFFCCSFQPFPIS